MKPALWEREFEVLCSCGLFVLLTTPRSELLSRQVKLPMLLAILICGVQAFGCIFHSIAFPHKVKWILGKGSYSEVACFHYQSDVVCQYCFAPNACCIGREKSSVDTSPHLFQATVERRKQRDYCRTNAAFMLWTSKSCCISCWIWYWSVQVPFEAI